MRGKTELFLTITAVEGDPVHDWGRHPLRDCGVLISGRIAGERSSQG
jgi:hypothetical protein